MNRTELANKLLPLTTDSIDKINKTYPKRDLKEGAYVTRFAPSPTGYLHIGGLYVSLINQYLAKQHEGLCFLRIEDTDDKRKLENGVTEIIESLKVFNIEFDEGPISEDEEQGGYGPYHQSGRKAIYQSFVKALIEKDLAYPCFCDEEALNQLRQGQKDEGVDDIGYYGPYASCRNLSIEAIEENLKKNIPYVIRLKSPGRKENIKVFKDAVRGEMTMPENFMDIVLLKKDGMPTYHFAHAVDDHLMGVTHVIRADEWIASMPIHVQLFELLGFQVPTYAHVAPIMKNDHGSRRKLSKRKDPEARVSFYHEQGYPIMAIVEYLLTIISSSFEEWRASNPEAEFEAFELDLTTMSRSGALFDFMKLDNISKTYIKNCSIDQAFEEITAWAKMYSKELFGLIQERGDWFKETMSLWKENRMDIAKWSDILMAYPYLYDKAFDIESIELPESFVGKESLIQRALEAYIEVYNPMDDSSEWFNRIKALAEEQNYCTKMKVYKKNPENYTGSIADFCTFIRLAVTGSLDSPDLYGILQAIGVEEVIFRCRGRHQSL